MLRELLLEEQAKTEQLTRKLQEDNKVQDIFAKIPLPDDAQTNSTRSFLYQCAND